MWRTALYLTRRDADWAKDLVQETLIKGYIAFCEGRFEDAENPRGWLTTILSNMYVDQLRRKQKWEAGCDVETALIEGKIDGSRFSAAPPDRPGEAMLAKALEEPVELALAALPQDVRACIVLVDIEDMPYAVAAAALSIPIGTVRSRLSRGRFLLHELLAEYVGQKRTRSQP